MPSLSPKDRVSLCSFTFADGRRCRTPRTGKNSRFCFYHAEKEAQARAAQSLGKDLAYFFSGDYLSACDLTTALGRLIPAVVRGDVKPRAARTVAYLAQTLLQAIHLSKHEYINAFGTDDWRKSIRTSVNCNHDYLFPPAPEQPASFPAHTPSPVCHPERSEGSQPIPATQPTPASQPAPSPHTPLPPTSAEFVQHVLAGLPRSERPGSTGETGGVQVPQPAQAPCPTPAQTSSPIPTPAPAGCHSDVVAQAFRPEEPAFSSSSVPSATSPRIPQAPASPPSPKQADSTPDKRQHPPATLPPQPAAPTPQPNNPPPTPSAGPSRDTPWWNFGDTCNIPPDSHLL